MVKTTLFSSVLLLAVHLALGIASPRAATAEPPVEADYTEIVPVKVPEGAVPASAVFEIGGLLALGDGKVMFCTRRGNVWMASGFYGDRPAYTLYADGLQEPMGLVSHEGWIYVVQRGELTRMRDVDGDDRADEFEIVCDDWTISGNYHEYAFGPRLDHDGNFWVTLNKPFGAEPFGKVPWRGWAMRITPGGVMEPVCAGLRSPAGVECSPWGDMFYTDNQGEWCGASKLAHLEVGDFHGHPYGIDSAHDPISLVKHPGEIPDRIMFPEAARTIPSFKRPAIWFPYDKMGKSPAGIVWDTEGHFPPFKGQAFVGDQHHASVLRCDLEKVNGQWQGACFPFRSGFRSGLIRVAWGEDGSLIAGMSNRGWGSEGTATEGIERLVWKGEVPFEIREMRARPDGFRLRLTLPADPTAAAALSSYTLESYTYRLHSDYGSAEMDRAQLKIRAAKVSADGMTIDLAVDGLRRGYVHELVAAGLRSSDGLPLLHAPAYYTLNEIPADG